MDYGNYHRGDILIANLNPVIGSEQGGIRPVVIIQNDLGNIYCPTLIVAPMTGRINKKKEQPTHYLIDDMDNMEPSQVLLEQIRTIDKSRVKKCIGKVRENHMHGIDKALLVSLGLNILLLNENV